MAVRWYFQPDMTAIAVKCPDHIHVGDHDCNIGTIISVTKGIYAPLFSFDQSNKQKGHTFPISNLFFTLYSAKNTWINQ